MVIISGHRILFDALLNNDRYRFIIFVYLGVILTVCISHFGFENLYGDTQLKLEQLNSDVELFNSNHSINLTSSYLLKTTSLHWHRDFLKLIKDIERNFECDVVGYIETVPCLIYFGFLMRLTSFLYYSYYYEGVFVSKFHLCDWMNSIIIVLVLTYKSFCLVSTAFRLEKGVLSTINHLFDQQKYMVYHTYNSTQIYDRVLHYWNAKYLPPRRQGVLSICGIIQFQDLINYMQYYIYAVLCVILASLFKLLKTGIKVILARVLYEEEAVGEQDDEVYIPLSLRNAF